MDYGKAKIVLGKDTKYIRRGLFGYTNPNGKEVRFYQGAFMSREELVKKIGHEKIYHNQIKQYGPTNNSVVAKVFE